MLGRPLEGSWRMKLVFPFDMMSCALGVLLECLLPSDGEGIACVHLAATNSENQKEHPWPRFKT